MSQSIIINFNVYIKLKNNYTIENYVLKVINTQKSQQNSQ